MSAVVKSIATGYDTKKLYTIVTVSDTEHADVRVMQPIMITPDGNFTSDPERKPRFFSVMSLGVQVHQHLPPQQVPVHFEIVADTLAQALERILDTGNAACQKKLQEMQDAQVRQSILAGVAPGKPN